jgi:hypothetical protein
VKTSVWRHQRRVSQPSSICKTSRCMRLGGLPCLLGLELWGRNQLHGAVGPSRRWSNRRHHERRSRKDESNDKNGDGEKQSTCHLGDAEERQRNSACRQLQMVSLRRRVGNCQVVRFAQAWSGSRCRASSFKGQSGSTLIISERLIGSSSQIVARQLCRLPRPPRIMDRSIGAIPEV